jgi:hypothetical protein
MGILESGLPLMGLGGLFLACPSGALLIVLTLRKAASAEKPRVTADRIDVLPAERYRPMLRLLDSDEFHVLRSQPGCDRETISRLRRQRCQIFGNYLRSLQEDFGQVCLALQQLMVHAKQDRPELANVLTRRRLQFACGMARVRWRLVWYRWGVGTVDAANLLRTFGDLEEELRSLIPSVALGA